MLHFIWKEFIDLEKYSELKKARTTIPVYTIREM